MGESEYEHGLADARSRVRQQAGLELLGGKATVDQIARRLGVHASMVEGWRQDALAGVEQALRCGSGKTALPVPRGPSDEP